MGVGVIYRRYIDDYDIDDENNQYDLIRKYLLNKSSITKDKKPIIWIHIPYEYNAREWETFYSRGTTNLNLPYQNLTIRSIIDHNPEFHVCLIDDSSFTNLIPGWTQDITLVGNPVKSKLRQLCLFKLLHIYGGMIVPSSFLCLQNLSVFYDESIRGDKPFTVENNNKSFTGNSNNVQFMPDISFMGAPKNNQIISNLCNYAETLISQDSTDESNFLGTFNKWCLLAYQNKQINVINGIQIGTKDESNKPIYIDDLIAEHRLNLPNNNNLVGIYIPAKDLLSHNNLNWFCKLNMDDVLTSTAIVSKYFIIAKANVN